jgi:hypothetical protein
MGHHIWHQSANSVQVVTVAYQASSPQSQSQQTGPLGDNIPSPTVKIISFTHGKVGVLPTQPHN